jgi:hypothetical protein
MFISPKRSLLLAAVTFPLVAAAAEAAIITPTVTETPGTTYNTAALTGSATTNLLMVGSLVTVNFSDNTTNSATWTSAGAVGTGWSLVETGDTFSSPWTFANTGAIAITGFTFDGVPGNTTFDIVGDPELSPGSARGKSINSVTGPDGLSVAVLYTNRLHVGGVFYGDQYTAMTFTFGGGGLTTNNSLVYVTDTDNAAAAGPGGGIHPAVPEPSTWAMMILGFAGVGFMAYRRRNQSAAPSAA